MSTKLLINQGQRFGRFVILNEIQPHRKPNGALVRMFDCLCDCGCIKSVRLSSLTSGATVSCGCFHKEKAAEVGKAIHTTHGLSKTQIYFVWSAMRRRCGNPSDKRFSDYGGRGIKVCERWNNSFEAFLQDMGPRPEGGTLERIDNNGNYEPGNVRWASWKEQARNNRRNHLHTINGQTKSLAEWCEILGEPWTTVKKRVAAGRDPFIRQRKRRSDIK